MMQRKTITITEQMDKSQVDSGRYGNDSEYFRDLIRQDQARKNAHPQLSKLLDDAEAGGFSNLTAEEIWTNVEAKYQ